MKLESLTEDYLRELKKEIDNYLNNKQLGKKLKKLKNINTDFLEKIKLEIYILLNSNTVFEKEQQNEIALPIMDSFTRMGEKINDKISKIITNPNIDYNKATKDITALLGGVDRYTKTLLNTGLGVITESIRINNAVTAGIGYYKYSGVIPEREFCIKHYNKVYTLDQINKLDNGQGLSVLFYRGGYNCRHFWKPITQKEYLELGLKELKNN